MFTTLAEDTLARCCSAFIPTPFRNSHIRVGPAREGQEIGWAKKLTGGRVGFTKATCTKCNECTYCKTEGHLKSACPKLWCKTCQVLRTQTLPMPCDTCCPTRPTNSERTQDIKAIHFYQRSGAQQCTCGQARTANCEHPKHQPVSFYQRSPARR